MTRCVRVIAFCLTACAAALGLAACDNAVEPLLDEPEAFFALHGFLDTAADTQFVRVEPLRASILGDSDAPLDAVVTSTHLQTGATTTWRDSLVTLDDGRTGHLFFARFRPLAGGDYRLTVLRPDGRASEATTHVPEVPAVRPAPPVGDAFRLMQRVTLEGLTRPVRDLDVHYLVSSTLTDSLRTLTIAYGDAGRPGAQGWDVDLFLARDLRTIRRRFVFANENDTTLTFFGLSMSFDLPSVEWLTPDAPANIVHGHGFFGAVGRHTVTWRLDAEAVRTMGFVDQQP
jgi:hypothetical protein